MFSIQYSLSYIFRHTRPGIVIFSILQPSQEGYELRKYETSVWTSAQMGKVDADEASDEKMNSKAFWSLFNYISGKTNEEKQKVRVL